MTTETNENRTEQSLTAGLTAIDGYYPKPELQLAADTAIALGMPLLLTGDPGTGKTLFAKYVAERHLGKKLQYFDFVAHTDSSYTDLFYLYNALAHFREITQSKKDEKPLTIDEIEKKFITWSALGEAIRHGEQSVVLIDEIDKAPRDLPNDLLVGIEKLRFIVPELQNKKFEFAGNKNPIIIITSNSEKDLPDAFLRRVVYFHIEFPNVDELCTILTSRIEGLANLPKEEDEERNKEIALENDRREKLKKRIANYFTSLRSDADLQKKPATAELLAWVTYLVHRDFDFNLLPDTFVNQLKGIEESTLTLLESACTILAKNKPDLYKLQEHVRGPK